MDFVFFFIFYILCRFWTFAKDETFCICFLLLTFVMVSYIRCYVIYFHLTLASTMSHNAWHLWDSIATDSRIYLLFWIQTYFPFKNIHQVINSSTPSSHAEVGLIVHHFSFQRCCKKRHRKKKWEWHENNYVSSTNIRCLLPPDCVESFGIRKPFSMCVQELFCRCHID